jgi:hypothetical protein
VNAHVLLGGLNVAFPTKELHHQMFEDHNTRNNGQGGDERVTASEGTWFARSHIPIIRDVIA